MKGKIVLKPEHARKLLHMGFTIIDIKPSKFERDTTIFVFEIVDGFMDALNELIAK